MHARILICHVIALAITSLAVCVQGTTAASEGHRTQLLLQPAASPY
jgi:hypothetical protein